MTRPVILVALLTGAAAALAGWSRSAPPPPPAMMDATRPAAATCGGCHADVYAEWEKTLHRRAWTNDNILTATQNFARAECRNCHSPEPVLPFDLELPEPVSPGGGNPPSIYRQPLWREANVEDGVHCLSCHGLGGRAGVAATRDAPGAPCRPRRDERLSSVAFCATCHDPTHQAAQEYWTAPQARLGITCHDCHMEEVERAGGRRGRSHEFPGGFSEKQVRKGLRAASWLEGREVVVALTNLAAHKFPGEIPSRALHVTVQAFDASGARVLDRHLLIRRSFKTPEERDRPDDRLLPGETREVREALPAGAARVEVKVLFRSLPLQPERHAILISKAEHRVRQ